ncbi:Brassinosteroid-related acyltransferase 1 [Bienertia sinuspersici]
MQPSKIIKLTNLDRQCPTLMYLVLFYNPSDYHNFNNNCVFSSLKSSLEATLSVWYQATGRLGKNPSNGNKVDLWCNNGGAIMVEAFTHVKISELGNLSQYNDFFENLVYKPSSNNGSISEMPLLVAQLKFKGYSVGIGTSHALFDGKATFNFLSAWASNNTQTKQGIVNNKPLEWHKPVHERDHLLQLITNYKTHNNNKNSANAITKVAAIQHLYQLIIQATPGAGGGGDGGGAMPMIPQLFVPSVDDNYVLRTFHFTTSMIDTLKRRAYGDTRTRVTPQLSQSFSGNAYVLASVALTAGELELSTHETLINMIKAAKDSVDNDYVAAYMEALEGSGDALPPLKELTIVSDWTRMPFHKINFMHPNNNHNNNNNNVGVYACPLYPPIPQVAYFMQSPKEQKGIDVRVGLNSLIIPAFSHYFLDIS